jgi:hypothetical protein
MPNISRRSLLTSSVVGLAAASTGCPPGDVELPPHRVNLICSGMMAFYWNRQTPKSGTYADKLTVLIPPTHKDGKLIHVVKFGGLGGTELKHGKYQLKLGDCEGPGPGMPPHSSDSYQDKEVLLRPPRQEVGYLVPQPSGIRFWIEIPKPTSVRLARPITKGSAAHEQADASKQFFCGRDADAYNIKPTTIPAFYILTYESVRHVPVFLADGTPLMRFTDSGDVQNLHLYAEPPHSSDTMEDHVELFTSMFKASDGTPLDLTRQASGNCSPAEGCLTDLGWSDVPDDLCRYDLATLGELEQYGGPGHLKPITRKPKDDTSCPRVGDPAGCINAWVDGTTSPYS